MKQGKQFLELIKFELFRGPQSGGGPGMWLFFLAMYVACIVPILLLLINGPSDDFAVILEIWQALVVLAWFAVIGNECAFMLVRESWNIVPAASLPQYNLDEFIVTRAVDRRAHFRIKTLICLFVAAGPLVLSLGLSFFSPEYTHPGGVTIVSRNGTPVHVPVIELWPRDTPNGTVIFAIWMIWAATMALVLSQGYYALIARFLSGRHPRMATISAYLPLALSLLAMILLLPDEFANQRFLFLNAFRLFATHPVALILGIIPLAMVVQGFCEKTFSKQEIL